MKLLILICSVLTVALAQEPSLSCRYSNFLQTYQCELTIDNPNGFNEFTEIGGTHLEGFTNADVTSIYRMTGSSTNVPRIICDTFPNLENFQFYNTGVTEVDDNAFSGCSSVRRIDFFFNRIESISGNAFASLSNVSSITLDYNLLTEIPENLFANQETLTELSLSSNPFDDLPNGLFRPLENLRYLGLAFTNLTAINSEWFSTNSDLVNLYLAGNRINLTANMFADFPESLRYLNLAYNGINEIPSGAFAGLTNLDGLELNGNNIDDGAFEGLDGLSSLSLSDCRIRDLDSISFEGLSNLTSINLNFNEIDDISAGTFASMQNLNYIGLWNNRIKTLRRNSFGALTALNTIDLDGNIINALDRAIIDDAVNLNTLYFSENLCANNYFSNFQNNRARYLPMLETCFRNLRYIVDITTEDDGVYSFFEGPPPGIVLRVRSDNEIQIALTPFNFLWTPMVEIFIGSTNNTRSVIRINEETDVVTVPTPNIIQTNQGNDFRITWANQNVLVFRGNETFPFMSYTMEHFFPVNFYGLRAVETRATWTVQPHNL